MQQQQQSQQVRNFVILFQEKEGSSAIVDTLQRFDGINVTGFEPFDRYRFLESYHGGKGRDMNPKDMIRCFELLFDQTKDVQAAYKEIKDLYAKYNHKGVHHWPSKSLAAPKDLVLNREESTGFKMRMRPNIRGNLFSLWQRTGTVVYIMYREDALKWALSKYQQGHLQFKLADGRIERKDIQKINVNIKRLQGIIGTCNGSLQHKRNLLKEMRSKGIDARLMSYEKFCFNKKGFLLEILQTLRPDIAKDQHLQQIEAILSQKFFFKKVHADDLRHVIANYDAVKKAIPHMFQKSDEITRKARI